MPLNKLWWVIPGVILIIIIFFVLSPDDSYEVILEQDNNRSLNQPEMSKEILENDENNNQTIFVDVKGEVKNTGVYQMKMGDRVIDVIREAGGLSPDADKNSVNLAMLLRDEMVIFVPKIGEGIQNELTSSTTSDEPKVRINTASKEELMKIPGIGEQKAKSIIEYRDENGYFNSAEDLLQISGIGEKSLEKIVEYIIVP